MRIPPYDDRISLLLRDHLQTEESDAGLRSPNLEANRSATSTPDAAAIARASSDRQSMHRRCRAALAQLDPSERNVLSLAYGVAFRSRDIDDTHGRKAPKKVDRNWRILLRDDFRDLGDAVAIVMASPLAIRLSEGSIVEWLRSEAAKSHRLDIQDESIALLVAARASFSSVYDPPNGEERLDAPKKRNRGRPCASEDLRNRILGGIHGREIGR